MGEPGVVVLTGGPGRGSGAMMAIRSWSWRFSSTTAWIARAPHLSYCSRRRRWKQLYPSQKDPMAKRVMQVDIKTALPSVSVAKQRLLARIAEAQRSGTAILKIIHGYGSTGVGGKLRVALRKTLDQLASEGKVGRIAHGEHWNIFDPTTQGLLQDYEELSGDEDLGQYNVGITVVEVRRKRE